MTNNKSYNFDVLIIGSGAAGLSAALHLTELGQYKIAILAKNKLEDNSTYYAQGGIAVVMDKTDSPTDHINDTIKAGAGLCNPKVVKFTIEQGPKCIEWLITKGVHFTKNTTNQYHLTQEGGHSHRRIMHATDATGKELESTLRQAVLNNPNITVFEHRLAIDLVLRSGKCDGAYVYNESKKRVDTFASRATIIASGGASWVYLYTSNPTVTSGDGIAMAWRAGCEIANMEFNQFHPTCLYHIEENQFLISEALRGEGAKLLLPNGKPFMEQFDARAELAPRDIVARAIDHEMKRLGLEYVLLDISHKSSKFITERFPNIYQRCLKYGFDITKQPIPVVPAAHYTCGGIKTDLRAKTNIANLYAIGEASCTGLHGANRMASNSLLECLVFADSASKDIQKNLANWQTPQPIKPWDETWVTDSNEEVFILHNWREIRKFMWDYVGIVRSNRRLQRAKHRVNLLKREIKEFYGNFRINYNLLELRNLITVAELIVNSALKRKESRGLHYTLDYLKLSPKPKNTILKKRK